MTSFQYDSSPDPIRTDLALAYRAVWEHIAGAAASLADSEPSVPARTP